MEQPISKQDLKFLIELQNKLIENAIVAGADDATVKSLQEGLTTLKNMYSGK